MAEMAQLAQLATYAPSRGRRRKRYRPANTVVGPSIVGRWHVRIGVALR